MREMHFSGFKQWDELCFHSIDFTPWIIVQTVMQSTQVVKISDPLFFGRLFGDRSKIFLPLDGPAVFIVSAAKRMF